ncbi:PREDICTED: putative OPA3-like protein CG13603 [Ceratosolen solmsi marchali]|uniref:OPA3-like protein CG13603 n=1 Tax=Ceratosolen solmsi marchali TaxID=326594 RepID=A0AAJ6YMU2_9HYME|nr:PREDICTED: putative OPA3-like protein CG13603 [Ceratosolen solmsi marchali]XP_011500932.1 PREDICTED: putative OPA3-like protein CG13603 [Ceratosolen solmsi marchali]
MAVGIFPALKLGVLFIKQISKPLAQIIVAHAKNHPVFRAYFIIPPAQLYHWAEVKTKMYLMNLGKPTKIAKLNEQMAIELGANLVGEVIIFSVAGGCLVLEYNRQVAKEAKREEMRQQQLQKFTDDIEALYQMTLKQETELKYLHNSLYNLKKETRHGYLNDNIINTNKQSVINQALSYYNKEVKKENPS